MHIPVTSLVIQISAMFPYKSAKVVPWRYGPKIYRQGQENQHLVINEPNVTTIVRPGGMTLSGRVFAPRVIKPTTKPKGKKITTDTHNPAQNSESQEESSSPKASASQKEAEEFLRIIKKSNYKVVD